jgi:hypothetical protein
MWNNALKLFVKGNFKRWIMCDEFDKFGQNSFKWNLRFTPNKTQNQ